MPILERTDIKNCYMEWIIKLVRFGIVGTSGMCIDFGTTWICKEKIGLNRFVANMENPVK